jgi:hypothetical protein
MDVLTPLDVPTDGGGCDFQRGIGVLQKESVAEDGDRRSRHWCVLETMGERSGTSLSASRAAG